jgi:hypothetical protein
MSGNKSDFEELLDTLDKMTNVEYMIIALKKYAEKHGIYFSQSTKDCLIQIDGMRIILYLPHGYIIYFAEKNVSITHAYYIFAPVVEGSST